MPPPPPPAPPTPPPGTPKSSSKSLGVYIQTGCPPCHTPKWWEGVSLAPFMCTPAFPAAALCGWILPPIPLPHPADPPSAFSHFPTAVTTYRVLEVLDGGHASLVQFKLQTGRTHQIRVHAAHLGHPVVGDDAYEGGVAPRTRGGAPVPAHQQALQLLQRPALHAHTLGFHHPATEDWLEFRSEVPPDMMAALRLLRGEEA